jgi:CysZ protein
MPLAEASAKPYLSAMINAAFKALGDLLSADFRSVLLKAVGMTLTLFVGILVGVEVLLSYVALIPWHWAEMLAAIGAGLGLLVAFFFMMSPVVAIFAGLYLDTIAAKVEQKHYPRDAVGTPLSGYRAVVTSLQFALLVLVVNLAALPLIFTGIGAMALIIANAYLLSREYFEMVAMRHMPIEDARMFRKENSPRIFTAGFIPAVLSIIPIVNLATPLFATSYFVHIFKQARASAV